MLTAEQLARFFREKARFNVNRTGIIENEKLNQAADIIEQQAALLAKYREALEFYANPNAYEAHITHDEWHPQVPIGDDCGKCARDALEAGMEPDRL